VKKQQRSLPIREYLVQNSESENQSLRNELLNVNMRLFASNKRYNSIIVLIIEYMKSLFATKFSDYSSLRGISGANIGIPINIIGFVDKKSRIVIMINPFIKEYSSEKQTVSSNCGSLVLPEAIRVERSVSITVDYRNESGEKCVKSFKGSEAFVIQHEIDHNNGILIIQKEKR